MVGLLSRSERLGQPTARRALQRHLEYTLPGTARPDGLEASGADELAHIVHRCAQDDQTGEKTDSLTRAVLAVTGDAEMVSQLRLLSDLNLARTRLSPAELSSLYALLQECEADIHDVARLALAPFPPRLPEHCTDPWSVTLHLLRRNAQPDGLPPFLAFLEYLAASLTSGDERRRLQEWNRAHAADRGLVEPLERCRAAARPIPRRAGSAPEPRIMFVLLPDGLDEDYCTLRVWHQQEQVVKDDDVRVRHSDLHRAVRQRLAHWTAQRNTDHILVEFWLGLTLLNLPVVRWCMPEDHDNSESNLRVVVRSLNLRPEDERAWRAHWSGLIAQKRPTRPALCAAGSNDAPLPPGRPLILAEPPDHDAGREQLLAALRQGVAAVMWDLGNADRQDFRAYAERLFDEAPLSQLPMRLARVQTARDGSPQAQALQDAVLMWDDPDRNLPRLNPLTAPDEVAIR
ncbi:hypothetical protein DMA15_11200 [Streptomyces sp. WAC 01529]|nr:hypothetical protein DMA15_11200 [Streptomyces sp. WAC 01529]